MAVLTTLLTETEDRGPWLAILTTDLLWLAILTTYLDSLRLVGHVLVLDDASEGDVGRRVVDHHGLLVRVRVRVRVRVGVGMMGLGLGSGLGRG